MTGTDLERRTRDELVRLLVRCGALAEGVQLLDGEDLLEVLDEVDAVRVMVAEASTTLRSTVVR